MEKKPPSFGSGNKTHNPSNPKDSKDEDSNNTNRGSLKFNIDRLFKNKSTEPDELNQDNKYIEPTIAEITPYSASTSSLDPNSLKKEPESTESIKNKSKIWGIHKPNRPKINLEPIEISTNIENQNAEASNTVIANKAADNKSIERNTATINARESSNTKNNSSNPQQANTSPKTINNQFQHKKQSNIAPKLAILPSIIIIIVFVYCFIVFTGYLSFTDSKLLPSYEFIGNGNYERLLRNRGWKIATSNLWVFGGLYILICTVLGLLLASFIDTKVRLEGVLRPIYLYPMALSFIVTGTAWKWILDPGIGLEAVMIGWGFENFEFDWIKSRSMAIYTLVIAAVWQSTGFVMVLFLAGIRSIDPDVIKAALLDGARGFKIFWRITLPQLKVTFLTVFVVLAHLAIKSYDLVIAMTNGGPGRATNLPATFMFSFTYSRQEMGIGAAAATLMLASISIIILPYIYLQFKEQKNGG